MKKRPARTVMEVCVARAGVMKGARVQAFISCWVIASQRLGRPITLADYADYWKENERTAYREQARFREVFPGMETPQPIADSVIRELGDQAADVGLLPATLLPA
jgi:hypothetical protein